MTLKDQLRMEQDYYCLQMGADFCTDGDFAVFTKSEISKLYSGSLKEIVKNIQDSDTAKDRKFYLDLLGSLRIVRFRLQ